MTDKITIRALANGGMKDMKIGEYEPSSVQSVIDLFHNHQWLDDDGEERRMKGVLLVVHDFMPFHVEMYDGT
jgi:hypothetical protein